VREKEKARVKDKVMEKEKAKARKKKARVKDKVKVKVRKKKARVKDKVKERVTVTGMERMEKTERMERARVKERKKAIKVEDGVDPLRKNQTSKSLNVFSERCKNKNLSSRLVDWVQIVSLVSLPGAKKIYQDTGNINLPQRKGRMRI
jgi:hypothetical protein